MLCEFQPYTYNKTEQMLSEVLVTREKDFGRAHLEHFAAVRHLNVTVPSAHCRLA